MLLGRGVGSQFADNSAPKRRLGSIACKCLEAQWSWDLMMSASLGDWPVHVSESCDVLDGEPRRRDLMPFLIFFLQRQLVEDE